jgi:hypothetical protein
MGLTATTAAAIKQLAAQEAEQLAPLEAAHVRVLRFLLYYSHHAVHGRSAARS